AQVNRLQDVARQNRFCPFEAVVDVHEGTRLVSISPNLNLMVPRELGLDHLPADGRRSLFATSVPGAMRPIYVVVTRHPRDETKILPEMTAHPLAEKFFPPITILRHRGISIALL